MLAQTGSSMKIARLTMALVLAFSTPALAAKHPKTAPKPALPPLLQPDLSGNDPHWVRDVMSDCWAYYTDGTDLVSFTWTGACKDHVLDGKGTLTWFRGSKMERTDEGVFRLGRNNGPGTVRWAYGDSYAGNLRDGLREGQGKSVLKNLSTYEGGFHKGWYEGHGVRTLANGDMVTGTFHEGLTAGPAVFKSASGKIFKGEIVLPHNDPALPVTPVHYPEISVRLDEEGAAVVSCIVGRDGVQRDIRIARSTGSDRLDQAAIDYVAALHVIAGSVGGVPVEMGYDRQVQFRLH